MSTLRCTKSGCKGTNILRTDQVFFLFFCSSPLFYVVLCCPLGDLLAVCMSICICLCINKNPETA